MCSQSLEPSSRCLASYANASNLFMAFALYTSMRSSELSNFIITFVTPLGIQVCKCLKGLRLYANLNRLLGLRLGDDFSYKHYTRGYSLLCLCGLELVLATGTTGPGCSNGEILGL